MSGPALHGADPLGFSLAVPDSWFELDLRPQTRDAAIQTLVHDRIRDVPELWEQRAGIVRILRRQAREAWEAGAVHCACMVEPTAEGPVPASITVSFVPRPPGERGDALAALTSRLRPRPAADGDERWTTVSTVEIEGVGTAARAAGIDDIDLPDGAGWVRVVQMQTYLRVEGSDRVVIVAASSPVLTLAEPLLDLFDAVTSTLRLVRPTVTAAASGPGGA